MSCSWNDRTLPVSGTPVGVLEVGVRLAAGKQSLVKREEKHMEKERQRQRSERSVRTRNIYHPTAGSILRQKVSRTVGRAHNNPTCEVVGGTVRRGGVGGAWQKFGCVKDNTHLCIM